MSGLAGSRISPVPTVFFSCNRRWEYVFAENIRIVTALDVWRMIRIKKMNCESAYSCENGGGKVSLFLRQKDL